VPTCMDMVKNGAETDVDCGGGSCGKCADGKACAQNTDCTNGSCVNNVCASGNCNDMMKNGSETDVDCGGAMCPKCADGKMCGGAGDCQSGVCNVTCQAPTCMDMVKNGAETDVDCGGGTCNKCGDGKKCNMGSDCQSKVCNVTCQAPSCMDGVKNGTESDNDCGGVSCPKCGGGRGCGAPTDCVSANCTGQKCAYRIFYTQAQTTGGTIGGVPGADTICQFDGRKPTGGTWRALIVDENGGARRASLSANAGDGQINWVLKANTSYARAADSALIMTTNAQKLFAIQNGQLGASFGNVVTNWWGGMSVDWTTAATCGGWTDDLGMGEYGKLDQVNSQALDFGAQSCAFTYRLLCVEQ
jgi:hypothetical protein